MLLEYDEKVNCAKKLVMMAPVPLFSYSVISCTSPLWPKSARVDYDKDGLVNVVGEGSPECEGLEIGPRIRP